ncbi:sugar transferase (plasmid) [Sphingobium sp. JS3065]|uniref:sugar transferase n=1 Tax=Sphingobium sp. JS3065 TaxID=2970925 RepID=UPI00226472AC|nr:sugar transferase [Sphingobium sp. JS3065]UZW58063.1 sugar transferase [Sphingobium sp. JS3065]
MKRVFDLAASLILFLPAVAICIIAAFLSWCEFRANPLFIQWRVGRGQQPFQIYKIRTMPPNTGDLPSHHAPIVTISRLSRLIRKFKADELPQLICVIRGDMSLVGPRPGLPSHSELIAERAARGVFSARPGITGLAQIQGVDMSDPSRLAALDSEYVRTRSMALDFNILAQTIYGRGHGDARAA